ncbi:MAG: radical SAM protein [Bacteriovoracia bacterium]
MWNEVYVERDISHHPRVTSLLAKIKKSPLLIESYGDLWGRAKKPYLQKRDSLNLFLAKKEGHLLKRAPDAYGSAGDPHYYFIHAYNCIYECQYCYLQGYFNTPDIVLFINHEEIIAEMEKVLDQHPGQKVWFHAGEFSDSLALTHLTGELEIYHAFCQRNPEAIIELRTKSVNTRELEKLPTLSNLIISFSLSPVEMARRIDIKTPGTEARLRAMKELHHKGWRLGAHFDPIVYEDRFRENYSKLLHSMKEMEIISSLAYLSLGVVRFTKEVYRETERNYPDSVIHTGPMVKSFDGKVRYHRPMRMWMMNTVKELSMNAGIPLDKIYLCMEEDA